MYALKRWPRAVMKTCSYWWRCILGNKILLWPIFPERSDQGNLHKWKICMKKTKNDVTRFAWASEICNSWSKRGGQVFHHSHGEVQNKVPQLLHNCKSDEQDSPDSHGNDEVVNLVPSLKSEMRKTRSGNKEIRSPKASSNCVREGGSAANNAVRVTTTHKSWRPPRAA